MPQQNKKQNKLKKILGLFNPKTLKGGIALFALVFAIGGGVYFLYRSFAATGGAGSFHTCWVKTSDKTLWCWGGNGQGQLGLGDRTNRLIPTKVNISNVSQVSTGDRHTCATKTDGTLWCWGDNYNGQLGLGDRTDRLIPKQLYFNNVSQVSGGGSHTCAAKSDGTLWCWGDNSLGQIGTGDAIGYRYPTPTKLFFTWKQLSDKN